jgi:hypothetical protein
VKKEARLAKGTKEGGFTQKQRQDFRGKTNAVVLALGKEKDKAGKAIPKTPKGNPRPQDVLRFAIASGVPFSIAFSVIRNLAKGRYKGDSSWQATVDWG